MTDIKFIKNEKENKSRIHLIVNGVTIDTVKKPGQVVFGYTVQDSISSIFYDYQSLIKPQTGLDISYNQIKDAYEQYAKETK
jgi:hypothetical protein